jgi:hypothetical protein
VIATQPFGESFHLFPNTPKVEAVTLIPLAGQVGIVSSFGPSRVVLDQGSWPPELPSEEAGELE